MTEEMEGTGETKSGPTLTDADLQRFVRLLTEARPELADPEKLRILKQTLNEKISEFGDLAEKQRPQAHTLTTVAIALSGAATLGLLAAIAIPGVPALSLIGAIVGLLGSKFVGNKIDQLADEITKALRYK